MSRTTLSFACLLGLSWVGAVSAQTNLNDPGVASLQNFSGGVTLGGTYFQVTNFTGNGVGYRNGYTQLGHMTPFWLNEDLVIASNSRLLITDTQQIGGNLGAFLRYYHADTDRIFGLNAYYDIDQSINNNHYRQWGFGVESLGQWLDFRANGYVPTQSGDHFVRALALSDQLMYFGNRIGFLGTGLYEEALWGGDWEIGTPLTPYSPWLRGYAGMYAYHAKGTDPVGVRARIEGWISDDLNVGVQVTDDRQFGTNVNAMVNFLFSGWRPTRWWPNFATRERMLIPVYRNWRIAAGTYEQVDEVAAFNPRTNQPYFITWVDNSQTPPGDGTYEHPFTAMPGTAPGADLILVRVGNTSALTPLASSIMLSDYQRMLGEGREHQIQAYANYGALSVPLQTFNLPQFTNTGLYPYLTGAPTAITLADNNEVSAFNIINSPGRGITNTFLGSNNFNLNYLNLSNNAGGGIILGQATGIGEINHVVAENNTGGGIGINSGFGPLVLTMDQVASNSPIPGTQLFGISINADNGPIVANLTNILANGNRTGIVLAETNSSITATLQSVVANDNVGPAADGIRATGIGGTIDVALTDVSATGNGRNGIRLLGTGTDITFTAVNLLASGNVGDNFNATLNAGSTLSGGLLNVNFDGSTAGSGIVLSANASDIGAPGNPFLIQNVTANGNFLDGLAVLEANGASVSLFVDPSHFNNNGRDGFHFQVAGASTLAAVFENDTLNDNGRSAVFGNVDLAGPGNSIVALTLTDTPGFGSGGDGMFIQSANGANIFVDVTRGDFTNSGQAVAGSSGVRFDAVDSVISLTMTDTFANNTAAYPLGTQAFGLQLNLDSTQFTGTVTNGNFSNSLQQGILANATNGTVASLTLDNVAVNGNGSDALAANVSNGSQMTINASNGTSFSNNGLDAAAPSGNGLYLNVDGTAAPSALVVNLDNVPIDDNRQNGIRAIATGTAANEGLLEIHTTNQTTIDGNGIDGVQIVNNAGVVHASFLDTDISSNARNGVIYVGTGDGAARSSMDFSHFGINGFYGTTDSNGADGLNFQVLAGNKLDLTADSVEFSGNVGAGINGLVDGVGSQVIINPFLQVASEFNGREGLNLLADNGGYLNANINGGSFSFNGNNGVYDGVHVVTDHNAIGILCFDGTVVNNNTGDGFDFTGHNNSQLYVALQTSGTYGTLSASNNGGQAIVFTLDTGASGGLFMSGANSFTNNNGGNGFTFTANGSNTAVFSFSGNADNNTGDGLHVEMTNVANAYIDIHDGSASNNGDNGIDIELNNVTFGAAPISVNFLQGSLTANPFNISNMTVDSNGAEGILINGTAVTMPVGTITGNTVTNSGLSAGGGGIVINLNGGSNIGTLTLSQNTASNNAGDGIGITVDNTTFTTLTLDQNVADQNTGNGISIVATNSSFNTLTVSNGGMHQNGGHGLNIDLTNTPIDTLNITGNQQGQNALIGLTFFVDGSTFGLPFTVTNNSSAANLTDFTFDISTNNFFPDANFDTDSPPVQTVSAAGPFTPSNGTEVTTGLLTVNGTTNPPGWAIPDESQVMTATFGDFNPSEDFQWTVDLDQTFGGDEGYSGDQLIGSTVTANFSNGGTLTGTMQAVAGFPQASQFVANGGASINPGISNNSGDGIHLIQLNSPINNLNITNNTVSANAGEGVRISQLNSQNNVVNITDNTISNNTGGDGIHWTATNSGAFTTINLQRNSIDTNSGRGIGLTAVNTAIGTLNITDSGIHNNTSHGIDLNLTGSPITTLNIADNQTTLDVGNSNAALNFSNLIWTTFLANNSATDPGIRQVILDAASVGQIWRSDQTPFGVGFRVDNQSDIPTDMYAVNFHRTTEGTDPLEDSLGVVLPNGGVNPNAELLKLLFNSYGPGESFDYSLSHTVPGSNSLLTGATLAPGLGITVQLKDGRTVTGTIDAAGDISADFAAGPVMAGISGNGGDGIHIEQVNSNIGAMNVTNNGISLNGGAGVNFAVVNNSSIGPVTITGNDISSNNGDGVRLVTPNLPVGNPNLNFTINNNTVNDNFGHGVNFVMNNTDNLTLSMAGNTFGSRLFGNGGMGVHLDMSGNSNLNATIGDSSQAANVFAGNGDAGVGVILSGNATAAVTVVNSQFNESIDYTDPNFAGVGLGISLTDSATLTSLTIGDATPNGVGFSGNDSHGFQLSTTSFAVAGPVTIQNFSATGNGGDGLNFSRSGASSLGPVTIDTGTITTNTGNGINITAADLDSTDTYTITNSTITGNGVNGILLAIIGDADLDVTISGNTISNNTSNGIRTTTNSGITDTPTLLLDVNNNTINQNGANGILIQTPHLANIDNNTISGNLLDGINIGAGGSTLGLGFDQITNNTITGNGDDGIDLNNGNVFVNIDNNTISGNTDDGIVMDSNGGGAQQIVTITFNDIQSNGGDGIQISARNQSGTPADPNTYVITNNLITDNGARGINAVNAGGTNGFGGTGISRTVTDLTISDNTITRNQLEGVYVINTASNTQALAANMDNLATAALFADGSVFALPILNLTMDNNDINSNGQSHNPGDFIDSSGLVIRVGTSDAHDNLPNSYTSSDTGGTASTGTNALNASRRGGVFATITNNTFSGDYAGDVTFQPFISTAAPPTTVGTWTDQNTAVRNPADDVFSVTSYVQDPLARMDLIFTNNTGDGLVAANSRASTAFYNNNEPEFKSRGVTGVSSDTAADGAPGFPAAPDDNGPFSSGTRGRNATRMTFRTGQPPTIAAGNTFRYSGFAPNSTPLDPTNNSTFRLETGDDTTNFFTIGNGSFSNSVGIGGAFGELPFVWGSF